jgi:GLPGLI family protein
MNTSSIFTFIYILAIALSSPSATAQYLAQGSIEFTRTTNARLSFQLEADESFQNSPFYKEMLKKVPKHISSHFKMTFTENQSIYFFDKEGEDKMPFQWSKDPASDNIVIKDFKKKQSVSQKEIYDEIYIINDSLKKYKWKIHDEVRNIAGFECRKATTVIHDSVVVIAYYTDRILCSSGPESFGDLPGMILGLAVPRLYTSWFATKVNNVTLSENEIKKMKKGKPIEQAKLHSDLEKRLKDKSTWGAVILWKSSI